MKKLLLLFSLLFLTSCAGGYTGQKSEARGEIYVGLNKLNFCRNNLNYICYEVKHMVNNPNLYFYDGKNYEILSSVDSRYYLFKHVTVPAWRSGTTVFTANVYGNGTLIAMHNSMAEAKKSMQDDIAGILNKKPKAVASKPKEKKPVIYDDGKVIKIGSGTGFVVSKQGHVISNNHVVGVCKKVMTVVDGKEIFLDIISTDKVNDLGLIKGNVKTDTILSIKTDGAELGDDIVAFGYPLTQQLSDSVKLTKGIVSSLSGLDNNFSQIQIDAAIQPGNSGGPVLNMSGQVVGVASSGLSKLYMAKKAQYIPENVNFAVASPALTTFLKANKINFSTGSTFRTLNTKDLAKIGKPATIQLFCMNTKAEYAKLKKAKSHTDILLDLD